MSSLYIKTPILGWNVSFSSLQLDCWSSTTITAANFALLKDSLCAHGSPFVRFKLGFIVGPFFHIAPMIMSYGIAYAAYQLDIQKKWQALLNRPISLFLSAGVGAYIVKKPLSTVCLAAGPLFVVTIVTSILAFLKIKKEGLGTTIYPN